MSELISKPIRIITGLCQTSSPVHVQYGLDLASIQVTSTDGKLVHPISGLRHCTIKSRTDLAINRKGMGVDYKDWENLSMAIMVAAIKGEKLPKIPITQGARWAEEIQGKAPDMMLALETMDWVHALLFVGHIQPGLGMLWLPSVMQLGEPGSMIAKVSGDNEWMFGAKNGKWSARALPYKEEDMSPTSLENTAAGLLGSYAVGVFGMTRLPTKLVFIERGMETQDRGEWRNRPDHQSARIVKSLLLEKLEGIPVENRPEILIAYDPSHTNGSKRRDEIVDDAVHAATQVIDVDGSLLYDMILAESAPSGEVPLSDAGQHITGEEVQTMVDRIVKVRPIFDRKNNLTKR